MLKRTIMNTRPWIRYSRSIFTQYDDTGTSGRRQRLQIVPIYPGMSGVARSNSGFIGDTRRFRQCRGCRIGQAIPSEQSISRLTSQIDKFLPSSICLSNAVSRVAIILKIAVKRIASCFMIRRVFDRLWFQRPTNSDAFVFMEKLSAIVESFRIFPVHQFVILRSNLHLLLARDRSDDYAYSRYHHLVFHLYSR